jgi:hypothetical protein
MTKPRTLLLDVSQLTSEETTTLCPSQLGLGSFRSLTTSVRYATWAIPSVKRVVSHDVIIS